MFNPLVKFDVRLIERYRQRHWRYLVAQTYERGHDLFVHGDKKSIVLTHYTDTMKTKGHLSILKRDAGAQAFDLEDKTDRNKLTAMLQPDSQYVAYTEFVADVAGANANLNKLLGKNIKRWIARNTSWHISREETIYPNLEFLFGEFFVILKYARQERRVKLEEIEKA